MVSLKRKTVHFSRSFYKLSDSWHIPTPIREDFFVLDAVKHNEMRVFPKNKIYEIIKLNEVVYGNRALTKMS